MLLTPMRKLIAACALGSLACASVATFAGCSDDDTTNNTTTDGGGTGDGGPTVTDGGPTSNECADAGPPTRTCTAKACTQQNGEPSVCVNDACVKLKSPECPLVAGAIEDDNAILIGSLFDLSGGDKLAGGFRQNSVELAVSEINEKGGVPTADGCGSRPLAYVSCDDLLAFNAADGGFDVPSRRRAARHLAEELKVAGIVGPNNSNNTLEISENITNPAKTLLIAPTAGAAEITTVPNATQDGTRVLYRLVPSDALQGKAISKYGERIAQELNKTPLKVAIVNRGDAFGNGLRDGVKANFILNGKPWGDASNAANIVEVSYPTTNAAAAYTAAVDAMFALQPDIIFWFGLGEITPNIIVPYEKRNPTTKPQWLSTTSGQRNEIINSLGSDAVFAATGFQARVKGTSAQLTTSLSQDFFNFRYKVKYPEPKTLIFGQTQAYDGTYLIAFASAAAKPGYGPLLSIDVAKGMQQTVGGTEVINVGPTKVKAGLETLRKGGKIDFNGASGALDFNPAVGEAENDYAIWCVRTDPNTSTPVFENVTGMTWKFQTNTLDGTYSCPQN